MNVTVGYTCQRTGCGATAAIELDELLYDAEGLERSASEMQDVAPEGWAWEINGLENVLHCPEHVAGAVTPNERREFELTPDQLAELLEACKPVPYMVIGGVPPRSPQENANEAWRKLGDELGFDWASVAGVPGKGQEFFTAVTK